MANRPSAYRGKVVIIEPDLTLRTLLLDAIHVHCPGLQACAAMPTSDTFQQDLDSADLAICTCGPTPDTYLKQLLVLSTLRPALPTLLLVPADKPWLADEALAAGATDVLLRTPGFLEQLPIAVRKNIVLAKSHASQSSRLQSLTQTLSEIKSENETLGTLVDRLEAMATTDPLTGLGNRRTIESRLDEEFSSSVRHNYDLSVLMIDLDGLKVVNDTLGHAAGDEMIQAAAQAIRTSCRKSDIAARSGGDEFTVLLPHTPDARAAHVAKRIISTFATLTRDLQTRLDAARARSGVVHVIGRNSRRTDAPVPGMSIGIASRMETGQTSASALVATADQALYAVKRSSPGTAAIYNAAEHAAPVVTIKAA